MNDFITPEEWLRLPTIWGEIAYCLAGLTVISVFFIFCLGALEGPEAFPPKKEVASKSWWVLFSGISVFGILSPFLLTGCVLYTIFSLLSLATIIKLGLSVIIYWLLFLWSDDNRPNPYENYGTNTTVNPTVK